MFFKQFCRVICVYYLYTPVYVGHHMEAVDGIILQLTQTHTETFG